MRGYLDSYYLVEIDEAFEILKTKTENVKSEMLLSVFDLIFRLQWTYESSNQKDLDSLDSLLKLLDIFRYGRSGAPQAHFANVDKKQRFEPYKSSIRARNLDLHTTM